MLEVVRRLVFSVVIGNTDIHLKNWSTCFRPTGALPALSPGCQLRRGAIPYIPGDTLALSFGDSL